MIELTIEEFITHVKSENFDYLQNAMVEGQDCISLYNFMVEDYDLKNDLTVENVTDCIVLIKGLAG